MNDDSTIMMSQELQDQLLDDGGQFINEITKYLCIFMEDAEQNVIIEGSLKSLQIQLDVVEFEIYIKMHTAFQVLKKRHSCLFKEINLIYSDFLEKILGDFKISSVKIDDIKEDIHLCVLSLCVKNEKKVI